MSIHHLERAARLPMQATRKLVFMALCDDADKATGIAMPGIETVMAWAGCGRSMVQDHLTALIADGLVERVSVGRIGRRAEFRVFARVACCSEHERVEPSTTGSGAPDALDERGSGEGPESVRRASGLDRTPPYPPNPLSRERALHVVPPGRAPGDPSPHDDLGGHADGPVTVADPSRCPRHQTDAFPPPCGACGVARRAVEDAARRRAADEVSSEVQRRAAENAQRRREAQLCRWCDDDGYVSGRVCDHEPPELVAARVRSGAELARAALRRAGDEPGETSHDRDEGPGTPNRANGADLQ